MEAAKRAHEHARRQDALWSNHLTRTDIISIDAKAALGRLEAAGLKPGEGRATEIGPALDVFVQALAGDPYEPGEYRPAPDTEQADA